MDKSYKHLNVLIAGGDKATRQQIKAACGRCGMLSKHVSTGQEAVEYFKDKRPPIVVVGLNLEDISGFMLIKRIKRLAWFTDFILFHHAPGTAQIIEAVRSFASDVLPFPATDKELDDALLRAANRLEIYQRIQKNDLDIRGQVEKQLKIISHDNKNYIHSASQSLEILVNELEHGPLSLLDNAARQSILCHLDVAMQALKMSYERNLKVLDEGLREDVHGAIDAFRDFDITALIRKCCEDMQTVAATRSVHIKLFIPPDPSPFFGLERGLYHVLTNLIHNAVKFSPRGGEVRIYLDPGKKDEDGLRTLTLKVSDDGPGFPYDEKDVQTAPSGICCPEDILNDLEEEAPEQGTGFGLSFIRDIVERHVGTMTKGSSSTGGANVTLYLPVLE